MSQQNTAWHLRFQRNVKRGTENCTEMVLCACNLHSCHASEVVMADVPGVGWDGVGTMKFCVSLQLPK